MKHIDTLLFFQAGPKWIEYAETQQDFETLWNNCSDPQLLNFIESQLGILSHEDRRLLACQLVRKTPIDGSMMWDLLEDVSKTKVIMSEKYAKGEITYEELKQFLKESNPGKRLDYVDKPRHWHAADATTDSHSNVASRYAGAFGQCSYPHGSDGWSAVSFAQCEIIREFVGNPFIGNERIK